MPGSGVRHHRQDTRTRKRTPEVGGKPDWTRASLSRRTAGWNHRNEWAHSKYVQAQNEAFSEPEQKLSARREKRREKLMEEVRTLSEALKEYGVEPPVGFPYVSEKDMEDWLALWQRFKRK